MRALELQVMFDVLYKMYLDHIMILRWRSPLSKVPEGIVFIDLFGNLPFFSSIFSINSQGILPVSGNKDTKFVCGSVMCLLEFGLLDHSSKLDFS